MTSLHHMTTLDIQNQLLQYRKTGIICTIGPRTSSVDSLVKLIKAGMNIVRLNFSHGNYDFHRTVIENARKAEKLVEDAIIAIALDTKGPEVRTGTILNDEISLEIGDKLTLSVNPEYENIGNSSVVYIDYKNLPKKAQLGNLIFIDDGTICLEVVKIGETFVKTKVINSGKLGSQKGVNLPDITIDLPELSDRDLRDLHFGIEQDVDMIFASFVKHPDDIIDIRTALGQKGKHIKIIAKIENREGVHNFDKILEVCDGVMVARGDLGNAINPEKVFLAQKMIISKCNIAGKPVICATQMLESMTFNPRPTRAEVSDVANAVLDGSDCVMLSGESAKGDYPAECVTMMANICKEAESAIHFGHFFNEIRALNPYPVTISETVACSAVNSALELKAAAIIVLTTSGSSAELVSKYRPPCPILTVTRYSHTAHCCHLFRACVPVYYVRKEIDGDWQDDVDLRIWAAIDFGKRKGVIIDGDCIVAIQGWKRGSGHTNTLRIITC